VKGASKRGGSGEENVGSQKRENTCGFAGDVAGGDDAAVPLDDVLHVLLRQRNRAEATNPASIQVCVAAAAVARAAAPATSKHSKHQSATGVERRS
jgi:hypothetical protein